jgi:hypothetical protein
LTTPYNPQQNGVAERKNRSIIEAAKAMINDQNLPMHLWEEASSMAVYVHNRSPHKILGNKTPEEVFIGNKPEVNHLRIFGCLVTSVYTCFEGEENEVGAFRKEGYLRWIQ